MSGNDTPRRVALDALLRVEDGAYAHIIVPEMLRHRRLERRDRALVTDFVYGTIRRRRTIDHLLQSVSSRPLDELDVPVLAALRLGVYQLLVGVPAHAAVGETVNVVAARARRFVNGVLRSVARLGPEWPIPSGRSVVDIGVRTSHPDWIVELLIDAFGIDDAIATLDLDNEPPPVTLRINHARADAAALATELSSMGVEVSRGSLVRDALLVRNVGDLARWPAIRDGRVTPQDQASQAIVAALDPQTDDLLLDVASAPGGKATAAAERMLGKGLIVAADVHDSRARAVARAAERVRHDDIIMPIVADGRNTPFRAGVFDRVLLDAPCSGLGVLRRRPDARWRISPGNIDELASLQRELLAATAALVRPGGRLVYSVCTLTPHETLEIDNWAARELPELVAQPALGAPWRKHGRGALLLPSDARTDGMFVLIFERAPVTQRREDPPTRVEASTRRWSRVQ
ncbi:MAG TPA: 16S rRNA (cytosine(967)-C(5))-methyltransferase RsmB [Acidimicrobiia bacterium]|nr:16S rRNA (cytosine(967)-C(5))-methyltransferase RsmB [Acidimicrobiia bacterium]